MPIRSCCLLSLWLAGALAPWSAPAEPPQPPPWPPLPLDFRQLLAMTPSEREGTLEGRTAQDRQIIEEKIREYELLEPAERQARLASLQLRLYLRPLLRVAPAERPERLAAVPEPDQTLVATRLKEWERLPPALQQELLENETAIRLLYRPETVRPGRSPGVADLTPQQRDEIEKRIARWHDLPEEKRRNLLGHFQQVFELSDRERAAVFESWSEEEQREMEKTLELFAALPQTERQACLRGFQRFAGLSLAQRREFLRHAELWRQMSQKDRQLWRETVTRLQPVLPPMPPGFDGPPLPDPLLEPRRSQLPGTAGGTNGQNLGMK